MPVTTINCAFLALCGIDGICLASEPPTITVRHDDTVPVAELSIDGGSPYPVAWTDFYRFLQGWSPGHWKLHRYSERLAREVLATL